VEGPKHLGHGYKGKLSAFTEKTGQAVKHG
jgi:hypothetical protein